MSSLGLGHAKVIVEVTRSDGSIEVLTIHHIELVDDGDSVFRTVEDKPEIRSHGRVIAASEVFATLALNGRLLPGRAGTLATGSYHPAKEKA